MIGKKLLSSLLCAGIIFLFFTIEITAQTLPDKATVLEAMQRANDYWINGNSWPGNNQWARSAYFTGNMAMYEVYPDQKYLDYALLWAENNNWTMSGGTGTRNADNQTCGQTYIALYMLDPVQSRIADITSCISNMVNSTQSDDWWWIDALYMAIPVFTRLGVIHNDSSYFNRMYDLYYDTKNRRNLYNESDGLWYRDENYDPPYTTSNGLPCYWSRGNGWVFGSHVRVLQYLPVNDSHRSEYISTFQNMAAALRNCQRSDGFWNVSLADPNDYGGPETSGTAFFTYGMAWGINNGLLDNGTYGTTVARAWNGMVSTALHSDGFLGHIQNVGKEPSSSQPVGYDNTSDFGVGLFLLAGSEVIKMTSGTMPVPGTTTAPTETPPPTGDLGDVNNDGNIDIVDALLIAQFYVGLNPSNFDQSRADVNCDGLTDIVDALLVAQFYVGLNPSNFDQSRADVNCDGSIDIVDALLIAQYYVGLVTEFC